MGPLALRAPGSDDWEQIARLADVAVAHLAAAPPQDDWVRARRAFRGQRRHWVAVDGAGAVVGYGALERDSDAAPRYRLFVVTDWRSELAAAEQLLDRLLAAAGELGAAALWLREYAEDRQLVAFFTDRGFRAQAPYTLGAERLVNLHRDLP